jgi:small subunit ribosomal protein S20
MPNHKSASKRLLQTEKRTAINKARKNEIKTYIRNVEDAIANTDVTKAKQSFITAQAKIHQGVSKGVLNKNTAARRLAKMNKNIKNLVLATAK